MTPTCSDPPGAEQLGVLCAPVCWWQYLWSGCQSHQYMFVCSLLIFLHREVCWLWSCEQIISSTFSLILPTEQVGAPWRVVHDGQQAVLFKSSPKSIGKEVLRNEKTKSFVIYCSMMMVIMDSVLDLCEMKLLMLNTKISEIILHPSKTKEEGRTKKGKSKGSMFV